MMSFLKNKYVSIPAAFLLCATLSFTWQPEEYIVKGILLEKISSFVEWPNTAENKIEEEKFIVGIIGKHKFGKILQEIYSGRKILNKELVIKYINNHAGINECRVLFIPRLKDNELAEVLEFVKKKPILTISDTKGYAEKGVHINFYTEKNNVRFEINEGSVKESGIIINHLLLSLAKIVENKKWD